MKEEIIFGKNSVEAILNSSDRSINKVYVLNTAKNDKKISYIMRIARENKIPIVELQKNKFSEYVDGNANHQGILASVSPVEYWDIQDFVEQYKGKKKNLLLVLLDGIEDPQNLGSIIRSSEVLGADGVIIPTRRTALVTSTVSKASSGAIEYIPIIQVGNIVNSIEYLKKEGFWVFGAEYSKESKDIYKSDLTIPTVLVMGSEGKGLSCLVKKNCDFLVKIPQVGRTNSLNVANALSIILYEALKQRTDKKE